MNQVEDLVLGKMIYDYGWRKTEVIEGEEYIIIAKAYKNDNINDNHRELYTYLKDNFSEIKIKIEKKLKVYVKNNYNTEYKEQLFFNKRIMIDKREKEIGFIYDTSLDVENGVGIKLINNEISEIGFQNIAL